MRLEEPLGDVFASRGHVRVLRALFEVPKGLSVSGREVARRSGLSPGRASTILSELRDLGLVRVTRRPQLGLFEPNWEHILIPKLEDLFQWERGVRDALISFLRERLLRHIPDRHPSPLKAAILFGSAVWGEMEPRSDIDLAIVCRRSDIARIEEGLAGLADEVESRFGSPLSLLTAPVEKVPTLLRTSPLWRRIADFGVPIVGSLETGAARA